MKRWDATGRQPGAGDAMGLGDKENSGRMGKSQHANGIPEEFQVFL